MLLVWFGVAAKVTSAIQPSGFYDALCAPTMYSKLECSKAVVTLAPYVSVELQTLQTVAVGDTVILKYVILHCVMAYMAHIFFYGNSALAT